MKTLIRITTAILIGLWSLVAWAAHALIGVAGQTAASNADILPAQPETIELVSWLATLGTSVGEWLVVAVWAIVSLLIVGIGYLATYFLGRARSGTSNGQTSQNP